MAISRQWSIIMELERMSVGLILYLYLFWKCGGNQAINLELRSLSRTSFHATVNYVPCNCVVWSEILLIHDLNTFPLLPQSPCLKSSSHRTSAVVPVFGPAESYSFWSYCFLQVSFFMFWLHQFCTRDTSWSVGLINIKNTPMSSMCPISTVAFLQTVKHH